MNKPLTANLALVVNGTLQEKERFPHVSPRFLRQARIAHESLLCRCGRCEPAYVHVSRNQHGQRAVCFHTGPLSTVVTFTA